MLNLMCLCLWAESQRYQNDVMFVTNHEILYLAEQELMLLNTGDADVLYSTLALCENIHPTEGK